MKIIKKVLAWWKLKSVDSLYNKYDYLEAYSKNTDLRVDFDYKTAIGGNWEELGLLQFEFLINQGLRPENSMLDIGMGTLRGGQHFIKFLDSGKYTGFDISEKAVNFSKEYVKELGLKGKRPTLLLNKSKSLDFEFLKDKFDFILAQSVFTHLKEPHIKEAFENLSKIMHSQSKFFFTIFQGKDYRVVNNKDIYFPLSFFKELADCYGFKLKDCSMDYDHPKKQKMLLVENIL